MAENIKEIREKVKKAAASLREAVEDISFAAFTARDLEALHWLFVEKTLPETMPDYKRMVGYLDQIGKKAQRFIRIARGK